VCCSLYADWISDEQKSLSNDGEKDIGKYHAALATVFEALSEAEQKECEDLVVEWNTKDLPNEVHYFLMFQPCFYMNFHHTSN
jgi:hypothetical protein